MPFLLTLNVPAFGGILLINPCIHLLFTNADNNNNNNDDKRTNQDIAKEQSNKTV